MSKKILTDLDASNRTITAAVFSGNLNFSATNTQLLVQNGTSTQLFAAGSNNFVLTQTTTGPQWLASSGGSSGFVDYQALTFNYR